MGDPTAFLVPPSEPDDSVTNGFANPLDLFNYVSPSAWLNEAVNALVGFDVFGWITDWIGGDWSTLWKFGDAMANLSSCLQQMGINTQEGLLDLDASWDGNAGDAAYMYFSDFAAAMSRQQSALFDCQDRYHRAALGAWQLSNQLGNISKPWPTRRSSPQLPQSLEQSLPRPGWAPSPATPRQP